MQSKVISFLILMMTLRKNQANKLREKTRHRNVYKVETQISFTWCLGEGRDSVEINAKKRCEGAAEVPRKQDFSRFATLTRPSCSGKFH